MSRRYRRGTNLVELLVVLVLGGALITVSVQVLQKTYAASSRAEQRLDLQRAVHQLSSDLRADLRQAQSADVPDAQTLVLNLPETSVTYRTLPDRIERTAEQDSQTVQSEGYRTGAWTVEWSLTEPAQVQVVIAPPRQTNSSRQIVLAGKVGR